MSNNFKKPDFHMKDIELRFEDDTVCIYGTKKGLQQLSDFCLQLIKHPGVGHIHLERNDVLTDQSEKGAIAVFEKE